MKGYKNLEELNKEWKTHGVHINEKGELIAHHEGKDYKIGQASFFAENGEPASQEEINNQEREREQKKLKNKKRK